MPTLASSGPRGRGPQPGQDLGVQPQDVPVQRARRARPGRCGNRCDLVQLQLAGPDPADHDPAAGGAEVDRGDADASPLAGRPHRRNAAATPASTGMCSPVVRDSSPAVSANTAAATCSGRTSRLSSVRWA